MEYSGQRRSNLLLAGAVWFFASGFMLLNSIPHQLPLRHTPVKDVYQYTLCFFIFFFALLVVALIGADRKLLAAYACYSVLLLIILMSREIEFEREMVGKIYEYVEAFLLLPYWGWMRIFKENTMQYLSAWFALSGSIAFFGMRVR